MVEPRHMGVLFASTDYIKWETKTGDLLGGMFLRPTQVTCGAPLIPSSKPSFFELDFRELQAKESSEFGLQALCLLVVRIALAFLVSKETCGKNLASLLLQRCNTFKYSQISGRLCDVVSNTSSEGVKF